MICTSGLSPKVTFLTAVRPPGFAAGLLKHEFTALPLRQETGVAKPCVLFPLSELPASSRAADPEGPHGSPANCHSSLPRRIWSTSSTTRTAAADLEWFRPFLPLRAFFLMMSLSCEKLQRSPKEHFPVWIMFWQGFLPRAPGAGEAPPASGLDERELVDPSRLGG